MENLVAPAFGVHRMQEVHDRFLRADDVGFSPFATPNEQLRPALFDNPSDGRLGQRRANSGSHRQSVQDIAQGAQPGDQDFCHSLLLNNSVVEWSFGSPTIATRPPQATTISRSGTVSAV